MSFAVTVFKKDRPRVSIPEWIHGIQKLQETSRQQRCDSYELRNRSNELRNETNITTRYETCTNNQLLHDRTFEVGKWLKLYKFYNAKVRDEISGLFEDKNCTEYFLESLEVPTMVVADCLNTRDQRNPSELARDELDQELNEELTTLETNKKLLKLICHETWTKLKDLNNVLDTLQREIDDKEKCLDVEGYVRELSYDSAQISYKPDCTRTKHGTKSENSYTEWNQSTIDQAESVLKQSRNLRERMFEARGRAKNEMYDHSQTVESVMRRRIYDLESARGEMDWQRIQLERALHNLAREIDQLQLALADKTNPHKLVETRLEERLKRPIVELVRDRVHEGLIEELSKVRMSKESLERQLREAISTYKRMENQLNIVKRDLANKTQALAVDSKLQEMRKPLQHGDFGTQTDRNIRLLNIPNRIINS